MSGWDVDMYIATFDRLALAASWDLDLEGTIAKFREGLSKGIHSKALDWDQIPRTIDEWKAAARTEVARAKEKYNAGLTGNQHRNPPKPRMYLNAQTPSRAQPNSNNSGIVPMEVDNATGQTNFKKLTPKNEHNLPKKVAVSVVAYKAIWHVIAQRIRTKTTIQVRVKLLPHPKNPSRPLKLRTLILLHLQSSPGLNKYEH